MSMLLDVSPQPASAGGGAESGYTVLARRYRSTDFDEVVGQEHVATTLKNAIERGRIAHAYLFTGTRGVGKTSMARILAKALNATPNLTQREEVGQAIMRGGDIDVIEIDAASNTGVDNVRDIINNAALTPARSPYKIYIIDEVHMLSKQAFNALLKIMEEPPSHVKFILCTTEVQKVPATIQSRCQRFDFRNIPAQRIAEHLRAVLARENVAAEEAAVREVARLAGGSMRDALSLLDRLIAAGDGSVTIETLERTVGAPDHAQVARLVDGIVAGDAQAALDAAGALLARGVSLEQAMDVLIDHLRNVMVIGTCGLESSLVDLFGEAKDAAARHAQSLDAPAIVHMIALCEAAARNIRQSSTGRSLFDAVIVRLALADQFASIPALLNGTDAGRSKDAPTPASLEKKKLDSRDALTPRPETPAARAPLPAGPSHSEVKAAVPRPSTAATAASRAPSVADIAAAKADPIVARAMALLGATIVDVRTETPDEELAGGPSEPAGEARSADEMEEKI
jgi:DNA polymerase-3 subunit gamma/tau